MGRTTGDRGAIRAPGPTLALALLAGGGCAAADSPPTPPTPVPMEAPALVDTTGLPQAGSGPFRPTRVLPLPIVFYTPETRWAGGAGVLVAYRARPGARPMAGSGTFIYTQNDQVEGFLALEGYTPDDLYHGGAELGARRFPDVLYGLGNDAPDEYDETYTSRKVSARLELKRRVARGVYVGGGYDWSREELVELEGGGPLSAGVPGGDGGIVSGLRARLLVDTRDHLFVPTRGVLVSFTARGVGGPLGGAHDFVSVELDGRRYLAVRPSHVVALRGVVSAASDGVPFQEMATLGGPERLRGYYNGRFRDRSGIALEAEYRLPVWWRFGVAGFAGIGQVAPTPAGFGLDRFHPAGGIGLRVLVNEAEGMNLRLDFGFGERGASGMYITVGEAF